MNTTRKMLLHMMEKYTEALIEKRPEDLPVVDNCLVTYNGIRCNIGDNDLWKNTLVIKERQSFVDINNNQVVFYGVMTNDTLDKSIPFPITERLYLVTYIATIRLKIINGHIVEIEELAVDRRIRNFDVWAEKITLPDLQFEIPIIEEERSTRDELRRIVETYWDCIEKSLPIEMLPIHPDAQRFENGFRLTNNVYSVRGDFKYNQNFGWDVPKASRSYPVIDEKYGIVISYCTMGNDNSAYRPRIVEAFKIKDGLIRHMLAFFPFIKNDLQKNY